ncbi:hypothetical protein BC833DRAFT_622967 [Globomyces pollinis-pini]|nr:hypothetical protein BC833DRAFT_622967 [Globomyces pollinis-pini]
MVTTTSLQPNLEFPKIIQNQDSLDRDEFLAWATKNKKSIAATLRLHGAILFRDFPIKDPVDFNDFVESLGIESLPYIGGAAVRHQVYKNVHTTNESPPDQFIPFHHEMSQVPQYPQCLFFYCDVAPLKGGETPLLQSDVLYNRVNELFPSFIAKLEKEGVIYTRIIPKEDDPSSPVGRGWKSTFQVKDKESAKIAASKLNVTLEWLPNGDVKTVSPILPPIKTLANAFNRKVFFNSAIAAYTGTADSRNDPKKSVCFGNGEYFDDNVIQEISKIMHDLSVAIPWKKGDVVFIDNNQVMHSRSPNFTPPRKIMAFLGLNCPYE